ncbi:ABC transporter ATP-binding protein [Pseudonocardia sp. TRM90224]|uniref:ABC transporter ATP-binding protein n=1 Tax=Pseudonocardia sp. TRM90224 TaxID=2812678 RepID=UPI001E41E0CC|nr:ABC transporter ATP-binding protein [Pseudonocardia sp. TRM90224]
MNAGTFLRSAVRPETPALAAAFGATAFQQLAFLAVPLFVQRAIDDGIRAGSVEVTAMWAGVVAALAVVLLLGAIGGEWFSGVAATAIAAALRRRVAAHIATLDRPALDAFGRGDLAMRVSRDVEQITTWVQGLVWWLQVALTIVLVLPAIFALDPLLLVVAVATAPLLVAGSMLFPRWFARRNAQLSTAHAARADAVEDLLHASAAVRGLGGEQVLVARHHAASGQVTRHTHLVARVAANWAATMPAVPRAAIAVGVLVGGFAALDGRTTVGGIVAFTSWMTMFSVAVTFLVVLLSNRGEAKVAAGRIAEVLDTRPVVVDPADPVALPDRGRLEVRGVPVGGGPLDLNVGPGELLAITGPTGSGKSTFARLLCRLDDPPSGAVRYGGIDLRLAVLSQVRARIGYVAQRPVVLAGTIADNLRMGRTVTEDDMVAAARAATFDRVVDGLPDGYATEVGEGGSTLSGGQVQRLALARTLLARPDALVLDDVTSAVDVVTERAILRGIRSYLPDAAVVVVTSRPGVLGVADRVVDLRTAHPEVVEAGRG